MLPQKSPECGKVSRRSPKLCNKWYFESGWSARVKREPLMSGVGGSRSKILVIEDEFLIAMGLEDALKAAGYDVVGPVAKLEAAVKAAERDTFDAALVDLDLEGRLALPVAYAL